jgi:hypothetical protein
MRGRPPKGHEIDWNAQPLGQESDAVIAALLGCTPQAVAVARRKRGIHAPKYLDVRTSISDLDQVRTIFEKNTNRDPVTGCLVWTGKLDSRGQYGELRFRDAEGRKYWRAHRVAWILAGRNVDPNKPYICHSCDNYQCVEISHLWAGTAADNNRDRSHKDRSRKGKCGARGVSEGRTGYRSIITVERYKQIHLGTFLTFEEAEELSRRAYELRNAGAPLAAILELRQVKRCKYRCSHWTYSRKPKHCNAMGMWWVVLSGVRAHSGPVCTEHAEEARGIYEKAGIPVEFTEYVAESLK